MRAFVILSILVFCSSCSHVPRWPPAVDPLKGWKSWRPYDEESNPPIYADKGRSVVQRALPATHTPLDKAIKDDYEQYLEKDEPRYYAMEILFFEDGTGQHAVRVQTFTRDRDSYYYIFIYDESNARVEVLKYYYGHLSC
jgi:hypothetical protein